MKKRLFNWLYVTLFAALTLMSVALPQGNALAFDATIFDPVPVQIKATGAGFPVGTIITWPVDSNPADAASWLDCDGRAITQTSYPELYALVGGNVPDYRGLFLRGLGSQSFDSGGYGVVNHESGELGEVQGDAIRNIDSKGIVAGRIDESRPDLGPANATSFGAIKMTPIANLSWNTNTRDPRALIGIITFNASNVVPTTVENRPANKAVRYLIRAKP